MMDVNCGFSDQPGRSGQEALALYGPTLLVEIGYDPDFEENDRERPDIPDDLRPALVDTGAAESCIDADFAREMRMPLRGQGEVAGIGGVITVDYYLAQIYVPGLDRTIYGQFAGINIQAGGQPCYALIGRDFLQNYTLVYQGSTGRVTLSDD